MDSLSMPQVAAPRTAQPAGTDGSTDLVIVVLNELACSGWTRSCACGADYTGTTSSAIAA